MDDPQKLATNVIVDRYVVDHGGRRRTSTVVFPRNPVDSPALVLVLHGFLQTGDSMREFSTRAFDALAARGHAVVAYPDAVGREWNGARKAVMLSATAKTIDDVGFLRRLVEDLADQHVIDRQRVFAVGYSLGGQMTIRLLHDAPDVLAGAVLIGCNLPAPENRSVSDQPGRAVPLLSIHGTADPLAPYEGGRVSFRGLFPKGVHLSALDTAQYFAARNGIDTPPAVQWLDPDRPSRTTVRRTDYTHADRPPVSLYTIIDGGHQIPGASQGPRFLYGKPSDNPVTVETMSTFFGLFQDR
ncbi:alpha/beta hydrolase family esterase [Nocardia sp. NBC_01388]|uniref:alpha/beta hydrolase family esterase n=1 Tax=Nocardia sp. NBC_01388 TaxID=2903596 RepID=UPI0032561F62